VSDDALKFCEINLTKNLDVIEDFVSNILKKNPLYYDISKIWYSWDNNKKRWIMIDKTDVVNIAKEIFGAIGLNGASVRTQFTNAITDKARLKRPRDITKYQIQLKDDLFDIRTNETVKVDSSIFAFNPIPHNIGESEETPIIDSIFSEWVGRDYIKLEELCAYCLLPDYPFARFWILLGSGSNGKSTFFEFLNRFLGNYNICGSDLELLFNNQFETAKLYKKLACIIGEADYASVKNSRKLKTITGNDPTIRFEFKGKDGFDGKNYAKVIISTNQLPETNDKTDGYYRRFICVNFPNQFTEKYDILAKIPEVEYENFTRKCLNILKRLLIEAKFTNEGTIEEKAELYERLSNPLLSFINEFAKKDANSFLTMTEIFDAYLLFLHQKGHNKINYKSFLTLLHASGYETIKKNIYKDTRDGKFYLTTEEIPMYNRNLFENKIIIQEKKTILEGFSISSHKLDKLGVSGQNSIYGNQLKTVTYANLCNLSEENCLNPVEMLLTYCRNYPDKNYYVINKEFSETLIQKCLRDGIIFMKDSETYKVL